jgi:hypothetical protein
LEETQSEDGLDSPEAFRRRILTFLEARQLAGEKWTAQAIAQKLDIPLEIAQIAVLNPIGQNIKVPIPDISSLYSGTLVAGDSASTGIFCDDGICKLLIGGIVMAVSLSVNVLSDLWNNIFQSKSKDVPKDNEDDQNQDNGKDQSKDSEKSEKIDPGKTIEKQLQGKGQLKDLRSGKNWDEKISINDALRKTYSELQDMVKNGELSKSGLRRIEKAFEGRDLGKRGKNK